MKHLLIALAAAAALAAMSAPPQDAAPPPAGDTRAGAEPLPEDDPAFIDLLSRLTDRAAQYRRAALGFTCREVVITAKYDIESSNYRKGDRSTYDYLFEERPDGTLKEFRELLVEKGKKVKRRSTDFDPPVPPAYTWASIFSKESRGRFHFRPAGQVVKAYRLLTLIDFVGISPNPGGDDIAGWSGQIALESRNLNIWSIRAEPSGQRARLEVEVLKYRRAFAIAGVPLASRPHGWGLDVTFGLEDKGLSYPTEQVLTMSSLASNQRMNTEEKTTFKYEDYRFFMTSQQEEVKETDPNSP